MKIMLNTNIYGRPFDDLDQGRIMNEALASFKIFLYSALGFMSIISSDVLFAEITLSQRPLPEGRGLWGAGLITQALSRGLARAEAT